jgi:chromosome segregation ATPase
MISKSEIIENLERNLFELDARFEKALIDLNKANAEISLRGREIERQAVEINRLNNDTRLLLTSQEVKDNANIALHEQLASANAEIARLRSRNITLELMLDGANAVERSLQQRNATQAETISRYRDEVSELSHGYKS